MILSSTSDLVQVVTTGTPNIDVQAGWADITATALTGGRTNTKISSATTTTIVDSPAASTQRQVKTIAIKNIHATDPNTVSVLHTDGTTSVMVYKITMAAGESAEYDGQKWTSFNASGIPTSAQSSGGLAVADIGSTAETVGGSVDNGTAATASRSDHKHAITTPKIDDLAAGDDNTDLNASTSAHGLVVKATAPAAGLMNFVGLTNGETAYTNKPLFDTTNPAALGSAAPGTEVIAARRDHVHAAPTTVTGNAGTVTVADAGGDTTCFPLLGTAATGSLTPATDAGLTYNATTDVLTATGLSTTNLTVNKASGTPVTLTQSEDAAAVAVSQFQGDRATPANNDAASLFFALSDSGGTQAIVSALSWKIQNITPGVIDGQMTLATYATGGVVNIVLDSALQKVTISPLLSVAGNITPSANDSGSLGTTALQFSDLFLAEGGVINWDNGDATLTQTGNVVLLAGATLETSTVGTAANSVATIDGVQTLTNKTYTLLENAPITLAGALSADGKYSGITEAGTAGTALAFGDICYLAAADSRWELADSDAEATSGPVKLGICVLAAAGDGSATTMLLFGKVRADAVFPAMTIGAPLYIGATAGDIVVTAPSTGKTVRIVGYANTADELFFNPDKGWVVL